MPFQSRPITADIVKAMSAKERIRGFRENLIDGSRSTMVWFCVALLYSISLGAGILWSTLAGYFAANSPYPHLFIALIASIFYDTLFWFIFIRSYRKALLKRKPKARPNIRSPREESPGD